MASNIESDKGLEPPKKGDTFRCESCGMELKITADCDCDPHEHVHFHCCGKEMVQT